MTRPYLMATPPPSRLRRALAEWDATPRDLALTLLAAPVCLLGLWAGLVLLIAVAG